MLQNRNWGELMEAGWNRVAGANPPRVAEAIEWVETKDRTALSRMLYGNGEAGERVASLLVRAGATRKPGE